MAGTVEDLPIAGDPLDERRVAALEAQAAAMQRQAIAAERMASLHAQVAAPLIASDPRELFARVLCACVEGRLATSVEGFLSLARELCDGVDREHPPAPPG